MDLFQKYKDLGGDMPKDLFALLFEHNFKECLEKVRALMVCDEAMRDIELIPREQNEIFAKVWTKFAEISASRVQFIEAFLEKVRANIKTTVSRNMTIDLKAMPKIFDYFSTSYGGSFQDRRIAFLRYVFGGKIDYETGNYVVIDFDSYFWENYSSSAFIGKEIDTLKKFEMFAQNSLTPNIVAIPDHLPEKLLTPCYENGANLALLLARVKITDKHGFSVMSW